MSLLPPSIEAAFVRAGGRLTFARFMDLALTDPKAGYYTAAERRVGTEGDFTTAPRRVPEFSQALARLLAGLADSLNEAGWGERFTLVEVGPGEGDLVAGVLGSWETERPDLKERVACRLIEVGEGLRSRQRERLADFHRRGWDLGWLAEVASAPGDAALVVSNELVDALPIHRVNVKGSAVREAWVRLEGEGEEAALAEEWGPLSAPAAEEMTRLFGGSALEVLQALSRDGEIELRPDAGRYLREVAGAFRTVCLVTVDYGDWLAAPQDFSDAGLCPPSGAEVGPDPVPLHGRSLRSYYRHQRGCDPYRAVGRQDLTADVDFRALAIHGREHGFDCLVYTSLARLLCGLGRAEEDPGVADAESPDYSLDDDVRSAPLRALRREDDLGGLFKVMVQVKEDSLPQE